MTEKGLRRAKAEAARFNTAVTDLLVQFTAGEDDLFGSRLSGYVRRVSMDLTRALADLRRGAER